MYLPQEQATWFEKLRKVSRFNHFVSLPAKWYPKMLFVAIFVVIISSAVNNSVVVSIENFINSILQEKGGGFFIVCFIGVFVSPFILRSVTSLISSLYARYGVGVTDEERTGVAEYVTSAVLSPFPESDVDLNDGFYDSLKDAIVKTFVGCNTRAISRSGSFSSGSVSSRNEDLMYKIGSTSSVSGFLYFAYGGVKKYCNIYRSFTKRVVVSRDSKGRSRTRRFYETWYFCELDKSVPSHITIGTKNFVTKKDTTLFSVENSKTKFRIRGDSESTQRFLTDDKKDELLALSKVMEKEFCIELVGDKALVVENRRNGGNVFLVRYNDTQESYIERIQAEINKMKTIIDYLSK